MTLPLLDRAAKEEREARDLAPYAMHSARSRGRRHAEAPDPLRTCFERDRDRLVHCTALRRLMHKSQVFRSHEADHQRTRLSHSLEVCQVARSVGGALRLNEPLCEALALAHDLGHPPFGHRGEWALDALMADRGGFRHNAQALRVVDRLERRSPEYDGLNLTREVRESLLKHEGDADWPEELLPRPSRPLLEAQVVDLADSTAYNKHDVEDGLLAGMFEEDELAEEVALWRAARERVEARHPGFLASTRDENLRASRLCNELIGVMIVDLIEATRRRIADSGVATPEDVRAHDRTLAGYSRAVRERVAELHRFLHARFYRHPYLEAYRTWAGDVVTALFEALRARPEELPESFAEQADEVGLERSICDYVAGMTDRFAEAEYVRLVGPLPLLSPR